MIGLVHLVWAPLGLEPVRRFLCSYHAHPSGAEHELALVLNGGAAGQSGESWRRAVLAELAETDHRLIELDGAVQDLCAYGQAARLIEHPRLCFVNSYATILADGWLGQLARALGEPDVGLVGASGSWESQAEWTRGSPARWPYQLLGLRGARRDYPRFPNPHVRTSAFMIEREAANAIGLERVGDKRSAYLLESGRDSITRQLQRRGLRPLVVGRDGRAYEIEEWPSSRTFRSGEQDNLLIADNQTDAYRGASRRGRRRLSRDSWGSDDA